MDDADQASEHIERTEAANIAAIRKAANDIPAGNPGECDRCGEYNGRIVCGCCSRCRDKYKL